MPYLPPGIYTIESKHYPGQYVSGDVNLGPIVSFKIGLARIQRWALEYDEEGFAMFQGRSPSTEVKGWIAIDEDGTGLIYTLAGPSKFKLQDAEGHHFVNIPNHSTAWELRSGRDDTPVTIDTPLGFQGNWNFTECRE